ncbi:MAG: hypothetical protein BAJALOKI1v1_870021 [Promethearchaeota archaeon]|nr:MAG: hypothetical protein BAJALOKI1v1_870021 [Candidatus Lokiarchaeota archaeon]
MIILKVYVNLKEGIHFIASARHFTNIHIDEPESFHGQNKGPSAVEYFLIGIGGCTGSTFSYCLSKNSIEINNLQIIVDGKLTHKGKKMNLRLIKIEIEINCTVKNDPDDMIELCLTQFREHCVITESISAGIPLMYNFNIKKSITPP